MPEDAAVRRAPDVPCLIKAIIVIADSGPGLAASSDETRGKRQVGNVASRMILRAVNPTTSQVVFYLAGLSVAGHDGSGQLSAAGGPRLAKRYRGRREC
jgi:hypothetical protein